MKKQLLTLIMLLLHFYSKQILAAVNLPIYLAEGEKPAQHTHIVNSHFALDNISPEEAVSTNIRTSATTDSMVTVTADVAAGVTSALAPERGRLRTGGTQPSPAAPTSTSTTLPPAKQLILYPCPPINSDNIHNLINANIHTSVGAFALELDIGTRKKRRYDFYVVQQSGMFSPLFSAGPRDEWYMTVPSYYKVANLPLGRAAKDRLSTIMETIAVGPYKPDDGKVTKTSTNTLQVGITAGYPTAVSGTGSFSVALASSVDIKNVTMYPHLGVSRPCETAWEYRFNNLGTGEAPRSLFMVNHHWIWRVDHEEAKTQGLYASTVSNLTQYIFPFRTILDVASRPLKKRYDCLTCLGFAKWKEGSSTLHQNVIESDFLIDVPTSVIQNVSTLTLYEDGAFKIKWSS